MTTAVAAVAVVVAALLLALVLLLIGNDGSKSNRDAATQWVKIDFFNISFNEESFCIAEWKPSLHCRTDNNVFVDHLEISCLFI